jgi:hypothetical protein
MRKCMLRVETASECTVAVGEVRAWFIRQVYTWREEFIPFILHEDSH